jgi:hypothetical protein
MPELTRRRHPERQDCWPHPLGVRIGMIVERAGPPEAMQKRK